MHLTACPYLGLLDDQTLIRTAPTRAHRCYARRPPAAPDIAFQDQYCLGATYTACPFYPEAGANATSAAEEVADGVGAVIQHPTTTARQPYQPSPLAPLVATTYVRPSVEPEEEPRQGEGRSPLRWLWTALSAAVLVGFLALLVLFALEWRRPVGGETAEVAVIAPTATPSPTPSPELPPQEAAVAPEVRAAATRFATPTALADGQVMSIAPRNNEAGWWASDETSGHVGDSFLYAGKYQGQQLLALARFDLRRIPRGAVLHQALLRMTGLNADRFQAHDQAAWLVQLLPEVETPDLTRADYLTALSAPAAITLPPIRAADLAVQNANTFTLDEPVLRWLEQQLLDGASSVTMRILATNEGPDSLFAWDSGFGPESAGSPPELIVSVGPAPPTPPPLPTRPFVVATLTPVPENVLTVVAQAATATTVAQAVGTYTPIPYQVYTPTPFPENLETVQAAAVARGLSPVLLATPAPANAETATAEAGYATAVALTTGTFTPVPTDFVTPIVIAPSPPAENVATAAARVLAATATAEAVARLPLPPATATPLPYNAVIGVYVYATATPGNVATAVAADRVRDDNARTTGTPTPIPWNAIVITQVPPTATPTPTPVPLFIPEGEFTPTFTPTATGTPPTTLPEEVRGKILFKSDRSGQEAVYMLDPATGAITLITQSWVYALAREQLALSPDALSEAIVKADTARRLQIHVYSSVYGDTRQITNLAGSNYDPAWSPTGEWIAFVSTDTGGDEIYLVDPAGIAVQRLTFNGWEWDKHPTWSPDGRQIVFFSNRETGWRQLWIMNADGSDQRNLSSDEYNNWDPVWVR